MLLNGCASKNVETSNTGNTETEPTVTTATETEDNKLEVTAEYTRREMALSGWQLAAKPEKMTDEEVDAVSGATPQSGKLEFVWEFTDSNGEPVPDGRYRILLEGNLYWESEILYTIEFDLSQGQVHNITTDVERTQPDEHTNEEMLTNLEVSVLNG